MLFNSYAFIFAYLPLTLVGFFAIARVSPAAAAAFLSLASLFFYGWWDPAYVPLLLASITFNYVVGLGISRLKAAAEQGHARLLLILGIATDLALLGYFKYANFFLTNLNAALQTSWDVGDILLPLGISFFTFTQIAYLVDAYRGIVREYNPVHYSLFVSYFPHLIAGPILHHKEMMPQFAKGITYTATSRNFAIGLSVFSIGLFKKVVLADNVAPYANDAFAAAADGASLSFLEAWGGALAYTLQLYFDFSGYSDMAIGLSLLFGVRLPLNFNSPYTSMSIVEFWRRWHMTLSRFLRDYLYIPLGGSRCRPSRHYLNLFATMCIGGLWHGAGWTFVIWGALHGCYLIVNHAWTAIRARIAFGPTMSLIWSPLAWGLTFLSVVIGWVFFRAANVDSAIQMLCGMAGLNGFALPSQWSGMLGPRLSATATDFGVSFGSTPYFKGLTQMSVLSLLLLIAVFAPNTQSIFRRFRPALQTHNYTGGCLPRLHWRPTLPWALLTSLMFLVSCLQLSKGSEFLYFNF